MCTLSHGNGLPVTEASLAVSSCAPNTIHWKWKRRDRVKGEHCGDEIHLLGNKHPIKRIYYFLSYW